MSKRLTLAMTAVTAGLSPALAQLFPPPASQQPGSSGSKGNHSSIYHSPFAAHPRSTNNLPPAAKGSAASLMPALPTSQAPMVGVQVLSLPCALGSAGCTELPSILHIVGSAHLGLLMMERLAHYVRCHIASA